LTREVVGQDDLLLTCLLEWNRFHIIQASFDGINDEDTADELGSTITLDQQVNSSVVTEIATRIRLNLIAPTKLVDLMGTGLFTKDQLFEAFRDHALFAERSGLSVTPAVSPETPQYPDKLGFFVVKGAPRGNEVNGIYAPLEASPNMFAKRGTYLNNQVVFKLFWDPEHMHGWLRAIPDNGSQSVDLYRASEISPFNLSNPWKEEVAVLNNTSFSRAGRGRGRGRRQHPARLASSSLVFIFII
jgi:hypothetical protein